MNGNPSPERDGSSSHAANSRLLSVKRESLLLSDWERALFIHFEVDAGALQAEVPFRLDLREGKAYLSLVAFTMKRMRPYVGGSLTEWCFKPMATHELLNVRTYVRHGGEAGIYFLSEWIPNRLSAFLGPRTFGLPYRLGRLDYQHRHEESRLRGCVESFGQRRESGRNPLRLEYAAELLMELPGGVQPFAPESVPSHAHTFRPCPAASLGGFLLERYTAFTQYRSTTRFFRVWHPPWPQTEAKVAVLDDSLLRVTASWFKTARFVGANYSPGVQNVRMGWPHTLATHRARRSILSAFYEMP